jgi:hypothetical protein
MSHTELDRFGVITRVRERRLTQVEAARMLNLGVRQVQRLCVAVAQQGADGLVSRKRGRPSSRRFQDQFRRAIVALISAHYSDFGPTLASEKLLERHQALSTRVRQASRILSDKHFASTRPAARAVKASHSLGPTSRTPSSGPEGLASAHVAPVCHMHYDVACPQWNGSIAVASRCTSKTTRLRTFTSSRQVTNVYLWLSNRSKYWRARPIHAM